MPPAKSSRKRLYIAIVVALAAVGGVAGYVGLKGASSDIDPTKVVVAETGTMVKSVVATGKIEPTTKVEIKSRANGIIERLPVDIDSDVRAGDVLAELDKEQLQAVLRMTGKEANSGVCIRINPTSFDDAPGYQVDMGPGYWGCLWEERRAGMVQKYPAEQADKLVNY